MEAAVGRSRREPSVDRELDPEDASLSDAGGREEEMRDREDEKDETAPAEDTIVPDANGNPAENPEPTATEK